MKINRFNHPKDTTPVETLDIDSFIDSVRLGVWKSGVERVRGEKDEKKQADIKRKMPCVTISGTFSKRLEVNLLSHSGFICMDFDHIEVVDGVVQTCGIENDPYTYALSDSIRGCGFFVIVKVNPLKHKESFDWLEEYYFTTYGLRVDDSPKNPASCRYVSYDPKIKINKNSKPSPCPKKKKEVAPKFRPMVCTNDQIHQIMKIAVDSNVNICESHSTWLRVGFALADELQEEGRGYFHQLSSVSDKYKINTCDAQYNACLKSGKSGVGIGTLYYYLKNEGVRLPKFNSDTLPFALVRKGKGITDAEISTELQELKGLSKIDADSLVKAIESSSVLDLSDIGDSPAKLNIALKEWISANYPVKLNEVTSMYELERQPLTDPKLKSIVFKAQIDFDSKSLTPKLLCDLISSDEMPSYNPFQEFYEKHKDMKTNGELSRICDAISAKNDITKNIYIRRWLIGAIASIHGWPIRYVLSLVGVGLTGKTEFIRRLLPEELIMYAGESDLSRGKDDELLMCQKLIVLIDEHTGDAVKDTKRFKSLTSKTRFDLRAPYARTNQVFNRLAIIATTSNQTDIINDHTGNNRIMPIEVLSVDFPLLKKIDKIALFVEMWRAYEDRPKEEEKERIWELTKEDHIVLAEDSKEYEVMNVERDLLNKYFRSPEEQEIERGVHDLMTLSEIKVFCESRSGSRGFSHTRFSHAVKEMDKDLQSYKKRRIGTRSATFCYMVMKNELQHERVGY